MAFKIIIIDNLSWTAIEYNCVNTGVICSEWLTPDRILAVIFCSKFPTHF